MKLAASILQLVGLTLTSVGAALWSPALGLVVGGAGLTVYGIAMER